MVNKSIGSYMVGRKNNLDFIRFIAASLVIFSHSFPISLGSDLFEPFYIISNGQSTLGKISVFVFFVTGGFLITQSYERKPHLYTYMKARVLRIFPALIFSVLITAFIIGPLVTNQPLLDYFSNSQTYFYLSQISLVPISNHLPGVFENNIYQNSVNGSLWSLKFEFLFYLVVAFLGVTKLLNKKVVLILLTTSFVTSFIQLPFGATVFLVPEMFNYFGAGMLIYFYRDRIPLNHNLFLISLGVLFLSVFTNGFKELFIVFGSYVIMYLAYNPNIKIHNFSKHGDFSYGLYIFAFPIQQTVSFYFGGAMNPILNFLISFPLTLILAYISWHLVEKTAMKLKNVSLLPLIETNKIPLSKKAN